MSIIQKSDPAAAPNLAVVLGKTVREQRETEGLTLYQVSRRSGFHIEVLRLIEEGVWIPNDEEVTVLAKALNCHWIAALVLLPSPPTSSGSRGSFPAGILVSPPRQAWGATPGAPGPGTTRMHRYS